VEDSILFAAFSRRTSLLLVLLLIAGATQAWAHAILRESTPALNSTMQGPDLEISMRFNVRIDGSRSRVLLVAPDGTSSALTLATQAKPDILQARATGLKPGAYKLQWKVLASDGHMSNGVIPFTVT
jgi:methionine-rich copper-binding protein CopC